MIVNFVIIILVTVYFDGSLDKFFFCIGILLSNGFFSAFRTTVVSQMIIRSLYKITMYRASYNYFIKCTSIH